MEKDESFDRRNYPQLNQNSQQIMGSLLYENLYPQKAANYNPFSFEDEAIIYDQSSGPKVKEKEKFNEKIVLNQKKQNLMQASSIKQSHKQYLRDIKELSRVQYYKSQFRFNKKIRDIYQNKPDINAREMFEGFSKFFSRQKFELCQIKIQVYCKQSQQDKIKKYQQKLVKIQEVIQHILNRYCYGQNPGQKMKIEENNPMRELLQFILYLQYIHFTLKIPKKFQLQQQTRLKSKTWICKFDKQVVELQIQQTKNSKKDYLNVWNSSYCNSLDSWVIGCRVKQKGQQTFYTYFQPKGENFVTFSRSMHLDQQANIKQICVYICFDNFVLRAVIKKEQIYLLSYSGSDNIYIFLSSPPVYEVCILPPKTYCRPNYLKYWSRVQNFLFLRHKYLKNNHFLRLFLYSNSYIHLKLNKNDQISSRNIRFDIEILQTQLRCKYQKLSQQIKLEQSNTRIFQLFDEDYINESLSFIRIPNKSFLASHIKWKLTYQLMLLIRFNVVSPQQLKDFLRLLQINQDKLDKILECLSFRSAGYTNKVAGLNRSRKDVYLRLKQKIFDFVTEYDEKRRVSRLNQNSCYIYKASLTPSGLLPDPISAETKCRLIRQYENQSDFFLKVTLLDDTGFSIKNQQYLNNTIMRPLLDKVTILNRQYKPLGWSGSQLRSSSLWYVGQINNNQGDLKTMTQQSILRFLGDFSKITVAAKKAARIGQAFSSSYCYNSQNIKAILQEDDKSDLGFKYTDGIGKISRDLFQKICQELPGTNINCCLQIRYLGAKGVLLLNEEISPNTIVLRKSMVKYDCNEQAAKKYLDILNWDKYLPGYLNRQIIMLLKSLNISDQAFLKFQRTYIKQLLQLSINDIDGNLLKIFNDYEDQGSFILTISSLKACFDVSRDLFFYKLLESIKETRFKQLRKKSRILIEQSARLIGVIDDYNILKQGELYCCVKKPDQPLFNVQGYVIITRNPSLSPGDVRKCRCVSKEEIEKRFKRTNRKNYFQHFINCIVFPKKGAIPLTAQISGSDLDGDMFFICWNKDFIIENPQYPDIIDDPNKKPSFSVGLPNQKHMLNFFVKFLNSQTLGRLNNIHTVLADRSPIYAKDQNCRKISKICGKVIDYAKSGQSPQKIPPQCFVQKFPDFMQKWDKPWYKSISILGKLFRQCKQQFENHRKMRRNQIFQIDKDLLMFIQRQQIKIHTIRQIMKNLRTFEIDISDLLTHANLITQFSLYGGYSSENQELRNKFGRSRLANWLVDMRQKHLKYFFDKHQGDLVKYRRLKSKKINNNQTFSKQIYRKAAMAYFITYLYYCEYERIEVKGIPLRLKRQIFSNNQDNDYKGRFIGYVWLIVPKIIINLKLNQLSK